MNNKEINKLSQPQGYDVYFDDKGLIITQVINGKSHHIVVNPTHCAELVADIQEVTSHE
jgi:hypothetical protein